MAATTEELGATGVRVGTPAKEGQTLAELLEENYQTASNLQARLVLVLDAVAGGGPAETAKSPPEREQWGLPGQAASTRERLRVCSDLVREMERHTVCADAKAAPGLSSG